MLRTKLKEISANFTKRHAVKSELLSRTTAILTNPHLKAEEKIANLRSYLEESLPTGSLDRRALDERRDFERMLDMSYANMVSGAVAQRKNELIDEAKVNLIHNYLNNSGSTLPEEQKQSLRNIIQSTNPQTLINASAVREIRKLIKEKENAVGDADYIAGQLRGFIPSSEAQTIREVNAMGNSYYSDKINEQMEHIKRTPITEESKIAREIIDLRKKYSLPGFKVMDSKASEIAHKSRESMVFPPLESIAQGQPESTRSTTPTLESSISPDQSTRYASAPQEPFIDILASSSAGAPKDYIDAIRTPETSTSKSQDRPGWFRRSLGFMAAGAATAAAALLGAILYTSCDNEPQRTPTSKTSATSDISTHNDEVKDQRSAHQTGARLTQYTPDLSALPGVRTIQVPDLGRENYASDSTEGKQSGQANRKVETPFYLDRTSQPRQFDLSKGIELNIPIGNHVPYTITLDRQPFPPNETLVQQERKAQKSERDRTAQTQPTELSREQIYRFATGLAVPAGPVHRVVVDNKGKIQSRTIYQTPTSDGLIDSPEELEEFAETYSQILPQVHYANPQLTERGVQAIGGTLEQARNLEGGNGITATAMDQAIAFSDSYLASPNGIVKITTKEDGLTYIIASEERMRAIEGGRRR